MHHFLSTGRYRARARAKKQSQPQRIPPLVSDQKSTVMSGSSPQHPVLTSEAVAALPPPGLSGPSSLMFSPGLDEEPAGRYLAFVASASMMLAHQPRRFVVATNASSSDESTNNTNHPTSTSTSTAGRASSSSERQLFVLDMAALLLEHSNNPQQQISPQKRLSGPPQPHEPLPRYNPNATDIAVKPMLRIPDASSSAAGSSASKNTRKSNTKRRIFSDGKAEGETSNCTGTNASMLASSFPGNFMGSRSAAPQQRQYPFQDDRQKQQQQRNNTAFPNLTSSALVQFSWRHCYVHDDDNISKSYDDQVHNEQDSRKRTILRLLVPIRGSLYIQHGILDKSQPLQLVYDKNLHRPSPHRSNKANNTVNHNTTDAEDPQLSPDGRMVAFCVAGEVYVAPTTIAFHNDRDDEDGDQCIQITFGATDTISHGVADFIAQEEMDRYRGFWWHPNSNGILLTKLDEANVPAYRILHQDVGNSVGAPTNTGLASGEHIDPNHSTSTTTTAPSSSSNSTTTFEDHRYPFAGNANPSVTLGFVRVDYNRYFGNGDASSPTEEQREAAEGGPSREAIAWEEWNRVMWYESPREAPEYLARVHWLPDGSASAQWQNRTQTALVMTRMNVQQSQRAHTLLVERSQTWINLHHMMKPLPYPIHPDDCCGTVDNIPRLPNPLPRGSSSFLFASERTGYSHLYLYTYVPGYNGDHAILIKSVSGTGEWMVESIVGIDMERDVVYVMGTYDSVLERHLYALPITSRRLANLGGTPDAGEHHPNEHFSSTDSIEHNHHGVRRGLKSVMNALSGKSRSKHGNGSDVNGISHVGNTIQPIRLTVHSGMHNIVMDEDCRVYVDTSSDLDRPTTVQLFALNHGGEVDDVPALSVKAQYLLTLYDAFHDEKTMTALNLSSNGGPNQPISNNITSSKTHRLITSLPAPELLSFPTSDGSETLHAALYRPDPARHGPGPYPLICAVYGGPHVQRVNRSWSQCADMRAQRLRSLGFCVVKCDNRGSSRRGMAFESSIAKRLGRLEVLDQVATVRQLTLRGIADPTRVGIYGWSYGGYLSAMCLCRAPDVFHVAVAGAPVTSWDGYDTHYTERYMGLPSENASGYRESAVFDHVPNMRGRLMIVHGLIDENVHFRHTARLINRLIGAGKDYDLLIFPDERHSPRRLRDRIYMEQRISDYFVRYLGDPVGGVNVNPNNGGGGVAMRSVPGHL